VPGVAVTAQVDRGSDAHWDSGDALKSVTINGPNTLPSRGGIRDGWAGQYHDGPMTLGAASMRVPGAELAVAAQSSPVLDGAIRGQYFQVLTRETRTRHCVTNADGQGHRRWGGGIRRAPTSYSRRRSISVWRRD